MYNNEKPVLDEVSVLSSSSVSAALAHW